MKRFRSPTASLLLLSAAACGGVEGAPEATSADAVCSRTRPCDPPEPPDPPPPPLYTGALHNGHTAREVSSAQPYYLWGNAKWAIQSWDTTVFPRELIVPDGAIAAQGFGTAPVEGTVVTDAWAGRWIFLRGYGFPISAAEAPNWPAARTVPAASTYAMRLAHSAWFLPDGFVFRDRDRAEVYFMAAHARFWIPNPTELAAYYGGWANVVVVPAGFSASAWTQPVCGAPFRERSSSTTYVFLDDGRYTVTDPSILVNYGPTYIVPDGDLASFPVRGPAPTYPICIN